MDAQKRKRDQVQQYESPSNKRVIFTMVSTTIYYWQRAQNRSVCAETRVASTWNRESSYQRHVYHRRVIKWLGAQPTTRTSSSPPHPTQSQPHSRPRDSHSRLSYSRGWFGGGSYDAAFIRVICHATRVPSFLSSPPLGED